MGKQVQDTNVTPGAQSPGRCFPTGPLCGLCREEGPPAPTPTPTPLMGLRDRLRPLVTWPHPGCLPLQVRSSGRGQSIVGSWCRAEPLDAGPG